MRSEAIERDGGLVIGSALDLDLGQPLPCAATVQRLIKWSKYPTLRGPHFETDKNPGEYALSMGKKLASLQLLEDVLGHDELTSKILERCHIPEGVCPHRVWNLAMATNRGIMELVSITQFLRGFKLSGRHRRNHRSCTFQFCLKNDEGTTEVEQYHYREGTTHEEGVSHITEYDSNKFNHDNSVWSLTDPPEPTTAGKYMATSHVWSDGTGVGRKT